MSVQSVGWCPKVFARIPRSKPRRCSGGRFPAPAQDTPRSFALRTRSRSQATMYCNTGTGTRHRRRGNSCAKCLLGRGPQPSHWAKSRLAASFSCSLSSLFSLSLLRLKPHWSWDVVSDPLGHKPACSEADVTHMNSTERKNNKRRTCECICISCQLWTDGEVIWVETCQTHFFDKPPAPVMREHTFTR